MCPYCLNSAIVTDGKGDELETDNVQIAKTDLLVAVGQNHFARFL